MSQTRTVFHSLSGTPIPKHWSSTPPGTDYKLFHRQENCSNSVRSSFQCSGKNKVLIVGLRFQGRKSRLLFWYLHNVKTLYTLLHNAKEISNGCFRLLPLVIGSLKLLVLLCLFVSPKEISEMRNERKNTYRYYQTDEVALRFFLSAQRKTKVLIQTTVGLLSEKGSLSFRSFF